MNYYSVIPRIVALIFHRDNLFSFAKTCFSSLTCFAWVIKMPTAVSSAYSFSGRVIHWCPLHPSLLSSPPSSPSYLQCLSSDLLEFCPSDWFSSTAVPFVHIPGCDFCLYDLSPILLSQVYLLIFRCTIPPLFDTS